MSSFKEYYNKWKDNKENNTSNRTSFTDYYAEWKRKKEEEETNRYSNNNSDKQENNTQQPKQQIRNNLVMRRIEKQAPSVDMILNMRESKRNYDEAQAQAKQKYEEMQKEALEKSENFNTNKTQNISIPAAEKQTDYRTLKQQNIQKNLKENLKDVTLNKTVLPIRNNLKEEDGFFQKSNAFDDGYQTGDIIKTLGSTLGDIGYNIVEGAQNVSEGIADKIVSLVADIEDSKGNTEYANNLRKNLPNNLWQEETKGIKDKINENSVSGNKLDSVAQGLGNATITVGTSAIPGGQFITPATTYLSSSGNAMSEALSDGATAEEAKIYSRISGLGETLTEYMFGGLGKFTDRVGISKGVGELDDKIAKKLSDKITSKIAKNMVQYGVKSTGEGVEEVASGIINAIGKKLTYKNEEELERLLEDENLLDQFVVGTMTSAVMQAPTLNNSIKTNTDYITGLTEQEELELQKNKTSQNQSIEQNNLQRQQSILQNDKTAKNQTSEQINDLMNNKAANSENFSHEQLQNNTQKQQIIDEINKSRINSIEKTDMIDTINSMENITEDDIKTIRQVINTANESNKLPTEGNYKYDTKRKQTYMKYKMDNNSYDSSIVNEVLDKISSNRNGNRTVKQWLQVADEIGTRLADKTDTEIERIAYKSWFDLQPTKSITRYDSSTKSNVAFQKLTSDEWVNTINKAVNEARDTINNQVPLPMQEQVKAPVQNYEYVKSDDAKIDSLRQDANKYMLNNEKTRNYINMLEKLIKDKGVTIRLDPNLTDSNGNIANGSYKDGVITINPNSTRAGEFIAIHELTHAIGTKEMLNIVNNYRNSNAEFDTAVKKLLKNYDGTEISEEALSDVAGQLFGNQEFINNLAQNNPGMFRKIYNEIKYLWHQFAGYKNQNQFIEDLQYKWEQAYRSNKKLNDTSKYHVSENLSNDIDNVINNINERNPVRLRDYTPSQLVESGIKDLPVYENPSHIRKNILTEDEARKIGLKVSNKEHYHGLGKETYIKAIDSLDDPRVIFKNKNNPNEFLILTIIKDSNNNNIIVPIEVETDTYVNNVKIDINRAKSVYGYNRKNPNLDEYIKYNIKNNNLEKIYEKKKPSTNITSQSASNNSIASIDTNVNTNTKYSIQESENNSDSFNLPKVKDGYTRLYRGINEEYNSNYDKSRMDNVNGYESWTDNYDLAKSYGDNVYYIDIPTNEIKNSIIDEDSNSETYGDRNLIYENDKPVGINGKSGKEYMLYTDHDNYGNLQYNKVENISTKDNQGRKLSKEQQKYFKDSKARNENGELETVYHGSNKAGFTEFNRNFNYFTNNKDMAQSYTRGNEMVDTRKLESISDAKSWLKGITDEAYIEKTSVYDEYGEKILSYDSEEELLRNLKKDIQKEIGDTEAGGIYEGYVNIENPVIVNANGDKWSMIGIDGISINGIDDINKFLNDYGCSTWKEKGKVRTSTNDIVIAVMDAVEDGNINADGVIIKDVYDEGGYGSTSPKERGTDYITFNSNQFKATDNINPTTDKDIRYSKENETWQEYLESNFESEGTRTNLGDIRLPNSTQVENNTIIPTNKTTTTETKATKSELILPTTQNQKFRKHYKSIIESTNTTEEAKKVSKQLMKSDTYVPESNTKQLERADTRIEQAGADSELNSLMSRAMTGGNIKADDIAVGERLIQYYSKIGDKAKLQEAIQATAMAGTTAGQTVQAMSLLNHQTPEGQAVWLQRSVEKMNNDLKKRRGQNADQFNLTPEMTEKIVNSKGAEELQTNLNEVYAELGQQVSKSTIEKIDAWRYFSMLANPKTHIRNIVGNLAMGKVQSVKNKVAGVIESTVTKINPKIERTHTLKRASKEVKQFAKNDIVNVADRLELNDNKYNPKTRLENSMRTFKHDAFENTLGKLFEFNNKALEAEDAWGLKAAYTKSLSEYMTANNLTPENITDKQLAQARNYAVEQAKEATFHQASAIATAVNQFSNKNGLTKFAADAVLPFKKTPINVAKAGLEYSPVGLTKSVIYDTVQLNKGNITVNQYIDNISKGLTGTGIAVLGYALAEAGILKASGGDDKDKEKYDEDRGKQTYSIQIGDNTYSLDWLAPTGIPLFIGAEVHEIIEQDKEEKSSSSDDDKVYNQAIKSATNILDSFTNAMNPMTEMSMLSGLTSALKSYDNDLFAGIAINSAKSYINQFIPTALGQVARTTDEYERSTTSTKTGTLPKAIDSTKNYAMSKIPGLRQMLPTKTDIWGKDQKQSENVVQRTLENAVLPYVRKEIKNDDVDKEISRLYDSTGENSVLPDSINKNLTINKEKYVMTSDEYAKYKKMYGETSYDLIDNLVKSNGYKKMTDEQKETAVENIYKYATEKVKVDYAKENKLEYDASTLYDVANKLNNSNASNYFEYLALTKEMNKEREKLQVLANAKYNDTTKKTIYENSLGKDDKLYITAMKPSEIDITEYLKYKTQEFESDKKDDGTTTGKTVSGSKKAKVVDYVNDMNITTDQKLLLLGTQYSLSNSEKTQLANYVNSLKTSKDNKLKIYEKLSGFTVYKDGKVTW